MTSSTPGATTRTGAPASTGPSQLPVRDSPSPHGLTAREHRSAVLTAYARVVFAGSLLLGSLCAWSAADGGGWPPLLQAVLMACIAVGSVTALALLRRGRFRPAFWAFVVPSLTGCTWGIVHAPGAAVSIYVLGVGLLAYLVVFVLPGPLQVAEMLLWPAVYVGAVAAREALALPGVTHTADALMLWAAPAMELVILVLAARITIGRLVASQAALEATNRGLETTVAARTEQLVEALAETDRLLLNVLPSAIAERLRRGEEPIADAHSDVTVLFADLVGFTHLAARTDPVELVRLLNTMFLRFDGLVDTLGLEKIKTIGDAYMAVGGLPAPTPDHAARVAELALGMVAALETLNAETGMDLDVRIGIHTGPVVAGVIGSRKFSYDLWGDTVNIASRMESHGQPGRIQVSEATRKALPTRFVLEERGPIELKGRGTLMASWLVSAG